MLARIALMFRNIHLGGASSGIRSIIRSKLNCPQPWRGSSCEQGGGGDRADDDHAFFIVHTSLGSPPVRPRIPRMHRCGKSAVLPNMHGQPPLIT